MGRATQFDWKEIKAKYETGDFSQQALSDEYGCSPQAIQQHIAKEMWVKGALRAKIEDNARNKLLKELDKRNLGPLKIADLIEQLAKKAGKGKSADIDRALQYLTKTFGTNAPDKQIVEYTVKFEKIIKHIGETIIKYVPKFEREKAIDEIDAIFEEIR